MAEVTHLYPTKTRVALLQDVADGKVADDADGTPSLDLGDERARVATAVWEQAAAGWVEQVAGSLVWSVTELGRRVLEAYGS
ncbi:hypothetical protein [Staphylococcus capitis]|uniref:hypothetical protein n=1 Tax=Staphylococcus capitis TaxID=29388 RepID=UPI003D0876EB